MKEHGNPKFVRIENTFSFYRNNITSDGFDKFTAYVFFKYKLEFELNEFSLHNSFRKLMYNVYWKLCYVLLIFTNSSIIKKYTTFFFIKNVKSIIYS